MSNAWQRDSHAGNAGIAIIFYKKRPIFCRNTQIDLVPDKEHIFNGMLEKGSLGPFMFYMGFTI